VFAIRDVSIAAGLSESIAPSIGLFGGLSGARWVAAGEHASLIRPGGLRFAALTADGALATRLLTATSAELGLFGKLACNKRGCAQVAIPAAAISTSTSAPSAATSKPSRTDYAMALSGVESTIWIAGGRDEAGNDLHDLVAYNAVDAVSETVPTAPLALGRVHALAWNPTDRRLYAIDEVSEGRRWFTRLVSIAPDWTGGREEVRWPAEHDERLERARAAAPPVFVLSIDASGHLWLGASRTALAHTVLRLTRRTTRDRREHEDRCRRGPRSDAAEWVMDGVLTRAGGLHQDGGYASDEGFSVAIAVGRDARVVGYTPGDLRPRGEVESWL
jgi:hypothetical protein